MDISEDIHDVCCGSEGFYSKSILEKESRNDQYRSRFWRYSHDDIIIGSSCRSILYGNIYGWCRCIFSKDEYLIPCRSASYSCMKQYGCSSSCSGYLYCFSVCTSWKFIFCKSLSHKKKVKEMNEQRLYRHHHRNLSQHHWLWLHLYHW